MPSLDGRPRYSRRTLRILGNISGRGASYGVGRRSCAPAGEAFASRSAFRKEGPPVKKLLALLVVCGLLTFTAGCPEPAKETKPPVKSPTPGKTPAAKTPGEKTPGEKTPAE